MTNSEMERLRAMMKEVAKEAAKEAVEETLTKLGVDHDEPLEMQADFRWVREFRTTSRDMKNKSLLALLGILITGSAAAFWIGFKAQILGAFIK